MSGKRSGAGSSISGSVRFTAGEFHRRRHGRRDRDWTISGVSLRSPRMHEQLAPQDGVSTVSERGAVLTEAFAQSVIEDDFAGPRLRWPI